MDVTQLVTFHLKNLSVSAAVEGNVITVVKKEVNGVQRFVEGTRSASPPRRAVIR